MSWDIPRRHGEPQTPSPRARREKRPYEKPVIVSYSNEAKERILGVAHEILVQHGAVSKETALAMATGARRLLGTDIAISVTGIAGPTGGTPDKPVGLVYIGLAAEGAELCQRRIWDGDRPHNKQRSAQAALELLLGYLED